MVNPSALSALEEREKEKKTKLIIFLSKKNLYFLSTETIRHSHLQGLFFGGRCSNG